MTIQTNQTNQEVQLEAVMATITKDVVRQLPTLIQEVVELTLSENWDDIISAVNAGAPTVSTTVQSQSVETLQAIIEGRDKVIAVAQDMMNAREATIKELKNDLRVATNRIAKLELKASLRLAEEIEEAPEAPTVHVEEPVSVEDTVEEQTLVPAETIVTQSPEELEEDPFAGLTLVEDEEEANPFAEAQDESTVEGKERDLPDCFYEDEDNSFGPVPEAPPEEEEVLAPASTPAPVLSDLPPAVSITVPAGIVKNGVTTVTYDVHGVQVGMMQKNAVIRTHANGNVRKMAFQLNDVMAKGNSRNKPTTQEAVNEQFKGKLYTQLIREWGLEIAAVNNMDTIKGDAGAALLISELCNQYGELKSPTLRFRNDAERQATAETFRSIKENAGTRAHCIALVDSYKDVLCLNPAHFVTEKQLSDAERVEAGYALLYARIKLTWENVTTKPTCVFPEVKKTVVQKGVAAGTAN